MEFRIGFVTQMVRFNFAKVLCKPDRVAFVNQIDSVCEHFVNWNRSVYLRLDSNYVFIFITNIEQLMEILIKRTFIYMTKSTFNLN